MRISIFLLLLLGSKSVVDAYPNNNNNPQYTLGLSYHVEYDTVSDSLEDSSHVLPDVNDVGDNDLNGFECNLADVNANVNASFEKKNDCHDVSASLSKKKHELAKLLAATIMNHDSLRERLEQILEEQREEDDDDEDDDDDDDDDGHSSMLSTPAYYRSSSSRASSATVSVVTAMNTEQHAKQAAMAIRGGGTISSIAENEMFRRLLVCALVTLMYEGTIGHILEFVKIVMQTSPSGTTYGQVLRAITADKGIAGLWDGFVPWGVIQSVFKGSVFGVAHHAAKGFLLGCEILPKQLALTMAGGIGGGFQGYVLSPTLLLKTRVMTDPVFREPMSMLRTTYLSLIIGFDVIAKEGISALMKGANVFALKRVFDWATRFYFSDVCARVLLSLSEVDALSSKQKIAADLLGGFFSTVSTLPLDVLVAKTQDAKKAGVKVSALDMFRAELKEKGWAGLRDSYMQGFEARLLHVCFTTVAMKTGAGLMYDLLFE